MSTFRVCVVYPDLLGTYGDGGNGEVVAQRARRRGIDTDLLLVPSSERLPIADLYCLGGGEDGPQGLAARRLSEDPTFRAAAAEGAVVFAVCAGFQILGRSFPEASGQIREGLGLLAMETRKHEGPRAVGEVAIEVGSVLGSAPLGLLSGFENHGGITSLDEGVPPLGKVIAGVGNGVATTSGDRVEGALVGRVVGTYLHGPVLARNAALADALLSAALGVTALEPLTAPAPEALRRERLHSLGLSHS